MISLDSSFQNSHQTRAGSLANLSSFNSSPRSNKYAPKAVVSSKSIEARSRNPSSISKKSGVHTPDKYSAGIYRDDSSPLIPSKVQAQKKDLESEIKKGLEAMKRHKSAAKSSLSRPLTSSQANSASNLSTNFGFSELRRKNNEKLNESLDVHSKSISEVTEGSFLTMTKDNSKFTQPTSRRGEKKGSWQDSYSQSSKSGKVSLESSMCMPNSKKSIHGSSASRVIQNMYLMKAKPLNLANVLKPLSKAKNIEEEFNKSKGGMMGNNLNMKENDLKGLGSKQNRSVDKKRSGSSIDKENTEKPAGAKKIDLNNNWSVVDKFSRMDNVRDIKRLDLCRGERNLRGSKELDIKNQSLQDHRGVNEDSIEHWKQNSQKRYLQSYESEFRFGERSSGLELVRQQLELFIEKIQGVTESVALREKKSLFIKLLEMLHQYKLRFAQFLATQEFNKKLLYFSTWAEYTNQSKQEPHKHLKIHQMLEESGLRTAISFHNHKLLEKYFYQGFLGHYVLCKLGNNEEELPPAPISASKSRQESLSTAQKPLTTPLKIPKGTPNTKPKNNSSNSKTPVSVKARGSYKTVDSNSKKKVSPLNHTFRSPNCSLSPNQSFMTSLDKSHKKDAYGKPPQKSVKKIKQKDILDHSFGKTLDRNSSEKCLSVTKKLVPSGVNKIERNNTESEDWIPDQILTNIRNELSICSSPNSYIAQPIKKDGLANIETPKALINVMKEVKPIEQESNKRTDEVKAEDREEDLQEDETKIKKALEFRKTKLLNTYGHKFISGLVNSVNKKLETVWFLRIKSLLKKGFLGLYLEKNKTVENNYKNDEGNKNTEVKQKEDDKNEDGLMRQKMALAQKHYEATMKINAFNGFLEYFVQSYEESAMQEKYRENYLMRSCFTKWFEVVPTLKEERTSKEKEKKEEKEENVQEEDDQEKTDRSQAFEIIVEKFRFIMLAEKAMRQLKALGKNRVRTEGDQQNICQDQGLGRSPSMETL